MPGANVEFSRKLEPDEDDGRPDWMTAKAE